ncbi:unnamed protein product [Protopolystoma xenopodis]|uniref:C2 domain-containing protein n=1 Tax=Protopolystoma xenopodis TaxID=117903 RepID=A0A448X0F0_9PLAT|nr:unnamed protein product [Protopolystoma xenopodis]
MTVQYVYVKVAAYQGLQGKQLKIKRTDVLGPVKYFNESFTFSKIRDPSDMHVRITLIQQSFFAFMSNMEIDITAWPAICPN